MSKYTCVIIATLCLAFILVLEVFFFSFADALILHIAAKNSAMISGILEKLGIGGLSYRDYFVGFTYINFVRFCNKTKIDKFLRDAEEYVLSQWEAEHSNGENKK